MATTRLRRVFRYPDDSDNEHDREELDEEEQEIVIKQLQAQNEKRNSEYSTIFSIVPLLLVPVFVPLLFSSLSSSSERLSSLVGVLSLLATAYTMKYQPLELSDPKGKKPMPKTGPFTPIHKYIVPVNAVMCALLVLGSTMISSTSPAFRNHSTYFVPAAMLSMVLIARRVMVSVDIRHLENLRYDYKGA